MKVKHQNKHLGILIFIGFLLIAVGIISYVVINYTSDQAEVKKRMDFVLNTYDTFIIDVDSFNKIRETVYNEIMQDTYYQTLKDNDTMYKEIFTSYEKSLKKIDEDYDNLKDKCINVLHPKAEVNNKCEAIIIGYEEVVNTYISDVTMYNKNIDSYNEWLNEKESQDPKLEKIKLTRDYIDINGDREYEGRKEIQEQEAVGDISNE